MSDDSVTTLRLNKFLAQCGLCSRRQADAAIEVGRVTVNGEKIKDMGRQVDPDKDQVTLDGRLVEIPRGQEVYLALNKPRGVTSTMADPHAKITIANLLPQRLGRLFPVGRLDKESQGLMLVTNDGALAHRFQHPSFEVEKEYIVSLERPLRSEELRKLRVGDVRMSDGSKAAPLRVIDAPKSRHGYPRYFFILKEGRNREIRELMDALEVPLKRLKRVRIGPVLLGDVPPGEWRFLSSDELRGLGTFTREMGEPDAEKSQMVKERRDEERAESARERRRQQGNAFKRHDRPATLAPEPVEDDEPIKPVGRGRRAGARAAAAIPAGRKATGARSPVAAGARTGKPAFGRKPSSAGPGGRKAVGSKPVGARSAAAKPSGGKAFGSKPTAPRRPSAGPPVGNPRRARGGKPGGAAPASIRGGRGRRGK